MWGALLNYLKRKYYDFRQGGIILAPILGLSNFMMLAYLTISQIIPLWMFAPIFIVTVLFGFTFIGSKFRKIQFSTDLDLGFERAQSQGETFYQILLSQKLLMEIAGVTPDEKFMKRLEIMKGIANGTP